MTVISNCSKLCNTAENDVNEMVFWVIFCKRSCWYFCGHFKRKPLKQKWVCI